MNSCWLNVLYFIFSCLPSLPHPYVLYEFGVLTNHIFLKACFDFARVIIAVMNSEMVPSEKLIRSISTILSEDEEELLVFRYVFRILRVTTFCGYVFLFPMLCMFTCVIL